MFLFPATLAQRRFWLLDQLVPGGNPALNVPLALGLRGTLDHAALERTFNEILRRHESLRTTFHSERGQLFQAIAPELTMTVPLVDVRDFPAAERAQVPGSSSGRRNEPAFRPGARARFCEPGWYGSRRTITCCFSPCTTSWRTAGAMACWCAR